MDSINRNPGVHSGSISINDTSDNGQRPPTDLDEVVAQANQMANTILLALRTVHEYISPRAEAHGIKLSARDRHAWAVSLSISLSQSKAYWKMPTTRVGLEKAKSVKPAAKELFSRPEPTVPFSDPAVLPALKQLRELLKRDSVSEKEILELLYEAAPRGTQPPRSLDATPERSLKLMIERWDTVRELAEAGRADTGGDAA